jgi:hypothetical protein
MRAVRERDTNPHVAEQEHERAELGQVAVGELVLAQRKKK